MSDIQLKGGPELMAFLDQLPAKLQKNVMRGALRAGAKVIQTQAKANVPAKSGQLRKAIKIDTVTDGGLIKARVKLRGKHSYLGPFMEYGVAAHVITAKGTGLSPRLTTRAINEGRLKIGNEFVGQVIMHPGFAPKPFLRPALDTKAEDAVKATAAYFAHRLQIGDLTAPALEVDDE